MNLGFWQFYNYYNANRMFTDITSEIGDDLAYPSVYLARRLREFGHQVNTLDMAPLDSFDAVCFCDLPVFYQPSYWKYYEALKRMDGKKLYLFLFESSASRPDSYQRSEHCAFEKVFTFDTELIDNDKYIKMRLPVRIPEPFAIDRSEKTKFCVAIFSQKTSFHPKELYSERIRAIHWFEREHPSEFDLFGQGWDRFQFPWPFSPLNGLLKKFYARFPQALRSDRFPSNRGPVTRKNAVMRAYKFAIAYENSALPGYVTEKIFDAFFAGCIPIYLGAPDVTDYIPPETFIDKRNFPDYPSLYLYLKAMSDKEYNERLDAIETFVRGEKIKLFGPENFTQLILKHIVEPHLKTAAARG